MSEMLPSDHDAKLTSVYRAAPADEPPAALDDAIRAAAHREVGSRPREAGTPFYVRWQMPLSAAAVLVLCVSLIAVMRDEGSELTQVPRAEAPRPSGSATNSADVASVVPKVELAPETSRSKTLGLKQPGNAANAPAVGVDAYSLATPGGGTGMRAGAAPLQTAKRAAEPFAAEVPPRRSAVTGTTDKTDTISADALAKDAARANARRDTPLEPSQPAAVAESRGRDPSGPASASSAGKLASAMETGKSIRQQAGVADQTERDARAPAIAESPAVPRPQSSTALQRAESMVAAAPAPAARASEKAVRESAGVVEEMTRMAPDKWLARIEELRLSGRLDEARAGLAEFRRRFPDYALPPSLRDGIQR